MRKITLAAVADAGLVRLGAGIRQPARTTARKAAPAPGPQPMVIIPAALADGGKVRLGAGIRRA